MSFSKFGDRRICGFVGRVLGAEDYLRLSVRCLRGLGRKRPRKDVRFVKSSDW